MATYFGYVEREADSYVNWADVGRNMSATIDNIQRVRDEKKALIEKAYREDLDFIQANPSGQHETINGWSLNFGNTSAENLKLKYSQLKQGKITVNDFVTFRQNLTDSVEKIYGVTGRLQEIYKDVEERTKNKENQLIERETKVLLEKYGQLENTLPYVNGLTGSVAIGLTDVVEEDGKKVRKLRQGEGSYLTPNQLQAAAEEKFNNYDEQPALDKWVEGLGDVQQDIRSLGGASVAGLITSVSDVTYDNIIAIINSMPEDKRPAKPIIDAITKYAQDFEEAENLFIDGILAKDTDASAILTEKIGIDPKTGKPYTVVWDKKDATSSDKLYVEKSSDGSGRFIPVFDVNATKDEEKYQMNALKNYLKSQLRVKYDRTAKMNVYTEPTPAVVRGGSPGAGYYDSKSRQARATNMGSYIGNIWSGDAQTKNSTLTALKGEDAVEPTGTKFQRGKDGSVFLRIQKNAKADPAMPFINIRITNPDGTPYGTVEEFGRAAGAWMFGAEDQKVLKEFKTEYEQSLVPYRQFTPFTTTRQQGGQTTTKQGNTR